MMAFLLLWGYWLLRVQPHSFQPDGTMYVTSDHLSSAQNPDSTIYTTTPTVSQWSAAAMLPPNAFPITVAWDGSGHPTAVWAWQALDSRATSWQLISDSVLPAG